MKTLISFLLVTMTSTSFAYYNPFEDVREELCSDLQVISQRESRGQRDALCMGVKNAKLIYSVSSKNEIKLKELPDIVEFYDAIELDILPDDSTSMLFMFSSILKDAKGAKIGYRVYHAYQNSEMDTRLAIESRFNLEGKLVSIVLLDF